jgi:ATP-dependent DNA helicase RecG
VPGTNLIPDPIWTSDPDLGVTVFFHLPQVTGEVLRLVQAMTGEMKRSEIQGTMGLKHEDHFRQAYLSPALNAGVLEMKGIDTPGQALESGGKTSISAPRGGYLSADSCQARN